MKLGMALLAALLLAGCTGEPSGSNASVKPSDHFVVERVSNGAPTRVTVVVAAYDSGENILGHREGEFERGASSEKFEVACSPVMVGLLVVVEDNQGAERDERRVPASCQAEKAWLISVTSSYEAIVAPA